MSGTHAETARAQADVQRADVQPDEKPHIPPGHVEREDGIRRLPTRVTGPVIGVGVAIVVVIALVVLFT